MGKVIERKEVAIEILYSNGANVRRSVGEIGELENSIEHYGILEPLIVRRGKGRKYGVVSGSRRFAAAQNVGLKTVPVIVMELSDEEAIALSLTENLHRGDLSLNEEADAIGRLYEMLGSQRKVAGAIDKSKTWVQLRLEAKGLVNLLSAGHHGDHPELPEDTHVVDSISRTGKSLFPNQPEKQIEVYEVLKDRPRDEVKRASEHLKAHAEDLQTRPVQEVVDEALKGPTVKVRMHFGPRISGSIITASEDRGITWEDVLRFAVERWLQEEGYLG